jgi:EAL domain-containing protein (putative c-di-GMP-specific phosphodiesterase class I)
MSYWYLECFLDDYKTVQRHPLNHFPFTIGREEDLSITIPKSAISRTHSRIDLLDDGLWIVDLNSRNGTFVNHRRIYEATSIRHGDILHIGCVEMRLMKSEAEDSTASDDGTMTIDVDFSDYFPFGVRELEELLSKEMISPVFQPIVGHDRNHVIGYELLGRGASAALPEDPTALFKIAESAGLHVKLSELMRNTGIERAAECGMQKLLFVNTHPTELLDIDGLLHSLHKIKKRFPSPPLVLEIHERAITNVDSIRMMKKELQAMGILLAFDDFGVGQSRFIELIEATPDIKFDLVLIQYIDRADPSKMNLVRQLHQLSKKLDIKTIAEGVHQQREYDVCRSIGFDYFQGFLFGKPAPLNPELAQL